MRRASELARVLPAVLLLLGPAGVAADGADLARGREVYERSCAVCHGVDGDGHGEAASRFKTQPRDFRQGVYKFRSTASGSLPTDDDLTRSIVHGLPGTAMVPQNHLSADEVRDVVAYIKTFSPKFTERGTPKPLKLPARVPREDASIARGKQLYVEAGCNNCHGPEGHGDGPEVESLSVRPANLTLRPLKGGSTAADIVRTIVTGLDGTPMPSYHLMLDDPDMWALAYYVESLGGKPRVTEDERVGWEVEGRRPAE